MSYISSSKMILVSGLLILMIGSTSILAYHFFSPDNRSEEGKSIVINSAELLDLAIGWSPHVYQVNIDFSFISDENFSITYGCSSPFWSTLVNTDEWQLVYGDCEALLTHSLYTGSMNYKLSVELIPTESDTVVDLPGELDLVVILGNNFVTSDTYTFSPDFTKGKSIEIKSAQFKTVISHEFGMKHTVDVVFDFTSDIEFDITYGCSSPFNLQLATNDAWILGIVDCEAILTHTLPAGTTEYSLSGSLVSRGINPEPPLPEQLLLRVSLGQNLLLSDVYTLALS